MSFNFADKPQHEADALASSFTASYAGVVAFIAVAAEGSFARAADRLGVGRSAVSRSVQKLEAQLDARLFQRTTRSTSLTREGELFFRNCHPGVQRIVQALEEMRELREGPPRGQLRIGATVGFGRRVVAPLLAGFRARYPELAIDLLLDDRAIDFSADRVDVAFREGPLEDSQLIAKRLVPMQLLICAAPDYAQAHGLPREIDELGAHACINYRTAAGRIADWEFRLDGDKRKLVPPSRCSFNDLDLVLESVLRGEGIAQLPGYLVSEALREGRLVTCLTQYAPDDRGHYLCYLSRQQLPTRMRVFIDYMTEAVRALDLLFVPASSPAPAMAD